MSEKEIRDRKGTLVGTISEPSCSSGRPSSIWEDLLGTIFTAVVCTLVTLGTAWGLDHAAMYSALWWLCIVIGVPSAIITLPFCF